MRTLIRHGIVVAPEGAAVRDVPVEGGRVAVSLAEASRARQVSLGG